MDKKEYDVLKVKFLKTFPNVPDPLREEIIASINGQTFNWKSAKEDISRDAKYAEIILRQLKEMGVL